MGLNNSNPLHMKQTTISARKKVNTEPERIILELKGVAELRSEISALMDLIASLQRDLQKEGRSAAIPQRYLSIGEAREYTGLSRGTLRKYFPRTKVGGKSMFDRLAIDAVMKEKKDEGELNDAEKFKRRIEAIISKSRDLS